MIPILYKEDATDFSNFGIGVLADTISCLVTEERNGVYELTLKYPLNGPLYNEIKKERIIKAKPNDLSDPQAFRIYRITIPINGIITVYAQHISYDLINIGVVPFSLTSVEPKVAIDTLLEKTVIPHNFSFRTDYTTKKNFEVKKPQSVRACLGGTYGSLVNKWGGEFEWDNFTIIHHQGRGSNKGVVIEYGKNLTKLDHDSDISEIYTDILPFAVIPKGDGTEDVITLSEEILPITTTLTNRKTLVKDMTDSFEEDEKITESALREKTQKYIKNNPLCKHKLVSGIGNIVQLSQEIEDDASVEEVLLTEYKESDIATTFIKRMKEQKPRYLFTQCRKLNSLKKFYSKTIIINGMIEFAAKSGSYFIRIRTKEKAFEKFYEVLRLYPHTEDEKYIYLDFEPVDYDFAKHLVNYEGDKLSIKELYHLNAIGFKVYEDVCKYRLYDGEYFVVDRKTREVFYPDRVINFSENYKTLNRYSLTFVGAIISFHDYRFANTTIDLGYELEGYDYRLIKIGNELFTMQPFMLDEDGRPDKAFLIEFSENAYKKHGFTSLYLWDFAKFKFEIFYARTGERRFFLPNYVEE